MKFKIHIVYEVLPFGQTGSFSAPLERKVYVLEEGTIATGPASSRILTNETYARAVMDDFLDKWRAKGYAIMEGRRIPFHHFLGSEIFSAS